MHMKAQVVLPWSMTWEKDVLHVGCISESYLLQKNTLTVEDEFNPTHFQSIKQVLFLKLYGPFSPEYSRLVHPPDPPTGGWTGKKFFQVMIGVTSDDYSDAEGEFVIERSGSTNPLNEDFRTILYKVRWIVSLQKCRSTNDG